MNGYQSLRLSTDAIAPDDRIDVAREFFGRAILNLDFEPDPDTGLTVDFDMRAAPGLKLVAGTATGVVAQRTKRLLSDGNDDVFLSINDTNRLHIDQRARSVTLGAGDAFLLTCSEAVTFSHARGRASGVRVPRSVFAHLVPDVEDRMGLVIQAHHEALRLLRSYVQVLLTGELLADEKLQYLSTTHIHDLMMLAMDAGRDAKAQASARGLRAARLQDIKRQIVRGLAGSELSIKSIAAANALTERYVQRLFETEGTTFSLFVSQQRLARAYRLLKDPSQAGRLISDIAYDCKFGDVSHFNRLFRRAYGLSPSDVRKAAR
jgi:AraC-like DNA-binding protein